MRLLSLKKNRYFQAHFLSNFKAYKNTQIFKRNKTSRNKEKNIHIKNSMDSKQWARHNQKGISELNLRKLLRIKYLSTKK